MPANNLFRRPVLLKSVLNGVIERAINTQLLWLTALLSVVKILCMGLNAAVPIASSIPANLAGDSALVTANEPCNLRKAAA